jgi:hypothetical protein
MNDTIILNTAIAPDLNSESIGSQNRSGPNTGIFPYFYIPDQIGILADKNGGINLWLLLPETSDHTLIGSYRSENNSIISLSPGGRGCG